MMPHTNSLLSPSPQSMFLATSHFPSLPSKTISFSNSFSAFLPTKITHSNHFKQYPCLRFSHKAPRCSVSVAETTPKEELLTKPSPAEVSRTIMELSSVGTLSTLAHESWPLGIGARFVMDDKGTPVLCLNASNQQFSMDRRCSFHVQLEQCGLRTPQCTLQGVLNKPEDGSLLKRLRALWAKRFEEEVDDNFIYVVAVEKVLQMEDFREDGLWVASSEYVNASPDPLRNFAEKLVNEMNAKHMEDVHRFCNIYVEMGYQVLDAKMIWVDRLGFDVHIRSQNGVYEARIPFPREVTDEKAAKSSFNCMSQLAWEVEKSYTVPEFEKVNHLKEIRSNRC